MPCLRRCSSATRLALRAQTRHLPGSCYPCQHPGGHGLRFCDHSELLSAGECVSLCCSLKDWGEHSRASSRLPASHRAQPGLEGSQTCYCAWWGQSAPPEGPSPPQCGHTVRRSAVPSRCRCSGGHKRQRVRTGRTELLHASLKPLKFKCKNKTKEKKKSSREAKSLARNRACTNVFFTSPAVCQAQTSPCELIDQPTP